LIFSPGDPETAHTLHQESSLESFLGVPIEGWKALAIWGLVLVVPWTYGFYFLFKIDQSGVARWGAKNPKGNDPGAGGTGA
jgi:hypothetical protein